MDLRGVTNVSHTMCQKLMENREPRYVCCRYAPTVERSRGYPGTMIRARIPGIIRKKPGIIHIFLLVL
jgi:hypothetical protein